MNSHDNFQQKYCSQLATATKMLLHLRNARTFATDVIKEKCIDNISKIYDKWPVKYIENCIDAHDSRTSISMNMITDIAIYNQNRNGTELKQILNAIEEVYNAFCIANNEDISLYM